MEFNGYAHGPTAVNDPEPGRCEFVIRTRTTFDGEFTDSWVTLCGMPTEDGGEARFCDEHWEGMDR
jgi:hypothetical protein